MSTFDPLAATLAAVRARIEAATAAAGRPANSVELLAVTKTFGPDLIRRALAAGQRDFGENYLQEALPKIAALPRAALRWHYIGPLQSNKTAAIAQHFDWVHSVDREKVARRLSEQRPADLAPLQVCVQVNISGETSKAGVAPAAAAALCRAVAALPRLRLRGLMAIPAPLKEGPNRDSPFFREGEGTKRDCPFFREGESGGGPYRQLRELLEALRREGLELDTLSAGMSDDLEAAIAEGSTIVRVGTAIFGKRRL